MTTSTIDHEVRAYIDSLTFLLSDLPEEERRELLDDLHQHLLEVAAEDEGSLRDRLGPPEEYAKELRASAELSGGRAPSGFEAKLRHAMQRVVNSPQLRALTAPVSDLRPGWWLLRGYLAVSMAATYAHDGYSRDYLGRATIIDVAAPVVFSSRLVGVFAGLAAAVISLQIGRRRSASWRAISFAATAGALALTGLAIVSARQATAHVTDHYDDPPYLQHADRSAISNICPYSSDGTLLSGVLLFDQEGRAIGNVADPTYTRAELFVQSPDEAGQPARVIRPSLVKIRPNEPAERSSRIENAYPRSMQIVDPTTGAPEEFTCPTLRPPPAAPETKK